MTSQQVARGLRLCLEAIQLHLQQRTEFSWCPYCVLHSVALVSAQARGKSQDQG